MNEKFGAAVEACSDDRDTIASSSASSQDVTHPVPTEKETTSTEHSIPINDRRSIIRASEDLRRTASNILTHVASRITTRHLDEPPPPPDGGLNAVSTQPDSLCHSAIVLAKGRTYQFLNRMTALIVSQNPI